MKKSLLIAILLLPLAFAKASPGPRIVSVPECFHCEANDGGNHTIAAPILPMPRCFPCEEKSGGSYTIAAPILPMPRCFPCEDKRGGDSPPQPESSVSSTASGVNLTR